MLRRRLAYLASLPVLAAGCATGTSSVTPSAPVQPQLPVQSAPGARLPAEVKVFIPDGSRRTGSAARRAPLYVSQGSAGLKVTVYAQSDAKEATPLATSQTNIAPGSSACTLVPGGRTCSFSVSAPQGNDTFVVQDYDAPPSANGQIPATAKVLSAGTYSTTIASSAANTIAVTLDGVLASLALGGVPLQASAYPDGAATIAIPVAPLDADGYTIATGTTDDHAATPGAQDDVLSSPVSVEFVEHLAPGETAGHATLLVDGVQSPLTRTSGLVPSPDGSKTTSSSYVTDVSTHTFAIQYDGKAATGYGVTVTLSAPGANVPAASGIFAPLFVTAKPQPYVTPGFAQDSPPSVSFDGLGESAQLTVSEFGDGTKPYTVGPPTSIMQFSCPNPTDYSKFATATIATPSMGVAPLTIADPSSSGGECDYAISDGTTSIGVPVRIDASTRTASGTATVAGKYVFVGDSNRLVEFDARATGTGTTGTTSVAPLGTTPAGTTGFSVPSSLKVDTRDGALVATSQYSKTVDVFKTFPFSKAPDVALTLANALPVGASIDERTGTLYVAVQNANDQFNTGSILAFANYASLGSGTPTPTARIAITHDVEDVATDGTNVYVASHAGTFVYPVSTFGTSAAAPATLNSNYASHVALDSYGNLFQAGGTEVYGYTRAAIRGNLANGAPTPALTFSVNNTVIDGIAFDAAGRFYATAYATQTIEYAILFGGYYQYAPLTDSSGNFTVQPQVQRAVPASAASTLTGAGPIAVY